MRLRTVPAKASFAALLLGLVAPLLAGGTPEDEARRLDDHLFFVEKLDRGWEPLLSDLDSSLKSLESQPADKVVPVRRTADAAREHVADQRAADGTEAGKNRAYDLYNTLAESCVDASRQPGFHLKCAQIDMVHADGAEKSGDDAKALDYAQRALRHVPKHEPAFGMIARLGLKVGKQYQTAERYEDALAALGKTVEALQKSGVPAGSQSLKDVQDVIADIMKSTGVPRITWIGDVQVLANVKGPTTDFRAAALSFTGAGKSPPQLTADKLRRIKTGDWNVTASGTGAGAPQHAKVAVTPAGGDFTLIPIVPDGMVFVPAAGEDGAFLIDRTEVSNAQWTQLGGEPHGSNPRAAVANVGFAEARTWADRAGKRLPTLAQWTHAAFGAPNAPTPRFPWGDSTSGRPIRDLVVVDATAAQDVESCAAGASPFGCLNMVGNAWEWVDVPDHPGGWLIGYGWNLSDLSELNHDIAWPEGSTGDPHITIDLLRTPIPSPDAYQALTSPAERRKWTENKAEKGGAMLMAGLRCIVPLTGPRR